MFINKPAAIVFDFDYTIFDTYALRKALERALERISVTADAYTQTRTQSKDSHGCYRPQWHARALAEATGIPRRAIAKAFQLVVDQSHRFLYRDTIPALAALKKNGHNIHLLTFGYPSFQRAKFNAARIRRLFDGVHFTEDPTKQRVIRRWIARGKTIVFVTDNCEEIRALQSLASACQCIRIRRNQPVRFFQEEASDLGHVPVVRSLRGVGSVMRDMKDV